MTPMQILESRINYKTISAVFQKSKDRPYTYKVPIDMSVNEGDFVIVMTGEIPKIVTVTEVHDIPMSSPVKYDLKWIIGVVDMESYNQFMDEEAEMIQAIINEQAASA